MNAILLQFLFIYISLISSLLILSNILISFCNLPAVQNPQEQWNAYSQHLWAFLLTARLPRSPPLLLLR